jgi:mannobiose 2-epimerase
MNLFFDNKWNPISFRDSTETERIRNFGLDHVSFGHDYETAFLMLEASYTLGLKNDTETLITAKKMLDHALQWGLDEMVGGFYDAGYYLKGSDKCTIIHDTKNWWAQAEGLNALLLMAKIFPEEEKYFNYFLRQLDYVDKYFIDHEYGGWYEGGIDKEPHLKEGPKGHIWKACYHEGRSLMNCIKMLSNNVTGPLEQNPEFIKVKNETSEFLKHWNKIGKSLK